MAYALLTVRGSEGTVAPAGCLSSAPVVLAPLEEELALAPDWLALGWRETLESVGIESALIIRVEEVETIKNCEITLNIEDVFFCFWF